ncbi:dimerization domain-containing protein [Streptoalloteichus tenebrarius]|uniref:Dimerization domain-containing protein n=1 Tax=Streptoalloteichus tenebrarius (strain ATCC 17920 / DSM 40477 / JCM 4838 / CBS 697.72 / NBRC 16177 / NCIMB 11028 / NRRL B-12390 / A12253. 1 / ISP 5477) TaxID=1933 RepID=A0ABT1HQP0_STRSD|nr:acetylserotonin O-methyltransferase [Streptoalloteichus tenebrarius]MCP2257812.1 dimerization domain-containing protein [Streptoalloteichus tenebrarius]BFE99824.1 methyltransferase [Streptoalloteichus tenebrarius]
MTDQTTSRTPRARRRDDLALAARMREMLFAQLVSRCLCAVTQLAVPDLLAHGPLSADELATRTGAHPAALRRLMRALVMFEVFAEPAPDVFALTPLGATLRWDAPASARPSALLVGDVVGTTWNELTRAVRTGRPAFREAFGTSFFDYLEQRPEVRGIFASSQAEGLALEIDEILAHAWFPERGLIVDVGGGDGAFLTRVLDAHPLASGIVFDLPATAALAARRVAERGLGDRCVARSGDFFTAVPTGGNLYLLSHVLHDWSDADALRLLRVCVAAMPDHATLLVIDLVTAERGESDPGYRYAALLDLYMLSLFGGDGGRERTRGEFVSLLRAAGLVDVQVRRLPSGMGVITARPGRTGAGGADATAGVRPGATDNGHPGPASARPDHGADRS